MPTFLGPHWTCENRNQWNQRWHFVELFNERQGFEIFYFTWSPLNGLTKFHRFNTLKQFQKIEERPSNTLCYIIILIHQCNEEMILVNIHCNSRVNIIGGRDSLRVTEEFVETWHDFCTLRAWKFPDEMLCIFLSLFMIVQDSSSSVFLIHPERFKGKFSNIMYVDLRVSTIN